MLNQRKDESVLRLFESLNKDGIKHLKWSDFELKYAPSDSFLKFNFKPIRYVKFKFNLKDPTV